MDNWFSKHLTLFEFLSQMIIGILLMPLFIMVMNCYAGISNIYYDFSKPYFWVIAFVLGLVLQKIVEAFLSSVSVNTTIAKVGFGDVVCKSMKRNDPELIAKLDYKPNHENSAYYEKYYAVRAAHGSGWLVGRLESQESFLRVLFFVECIYFIAFIVIPFCGGDNSPATKCDCCLVARCSCCPATKCKYCLLIILTIIALVCTYFAHSFLQRKIYSTVQEQYYFIKTKTLPMGNPVHAITSEESDPISQTTGSGSNTVVTGNTNCSIEVKFVNEDS